MKKLFVLILTITALIFSSCGQTKKTGEISPKKAVIYFSVSSYAFFTEDKSIVDELANFYSTLKVAKTDKELDLLSAYYVVLDKNSFWIDKNGVIRIDDDRTNYEKVSGTIDYNRIAEMYEKSKNHKFPFLEPSFKDVTFNYGQYTYRNVTQEQLSKYINELVKSGFNMFQGEYTYFLQRDNVFIRIINNTKGSQHFDLTYVEGMPEKYGTISCSQAKSIIGDNIIGTIEIYVPDLYEKTGAQLFSAVSSDSEKGYWPMKYLIKNNKAFPIETFYDGFVAADIDKDNKYELIYLTPGPTSGIFTFGVNILNVEENISLKYSGTFSPGVWSNMTLLSQNSEVFICSAEYINEKKVPVSKLFKIKVIGEELKVFDKDNKEVKKFGMK